MHSIVYSLNGRADPGRQSTTILMGKILIKVVHGNEFIGKVTFKECDKMAVCDNSHLNGSCSPTGGTGLQGMRCSARYAMHALSWCSHAMLPITHRTSMEHLPQMRVWCLQLHAHLRQVPPYRFRGAAQGGAQPVVWVGQLPCPHYPTLTIPFMCCCRRGRAPAAADCGKNPHSTGTGSAPVQGNGRSPLLEPLQSHSPTPPPILGAQSTAAEGH